MRRGEVVLRCAGWFGEGPQNPTVDRLSALVGGGGGELLSTFALCLSRSLVLPFSPSLTLNSLGKGARVHPWLQHLTAWLCPACLPACTVTGLTGLPRKYRTVLQ